MARHIFCPNELRVIDCPLNILCIFKNGDNDSSDTEEALSLNKSYLLQSVKSYIPFNPYDDKGVGEHERYSRNGIKFYSISSSTQTTQLLNDKNLIPGYKWEFRKWLFKLFDEGIQMDYNGFFETTPEDVALHVVNTISMLSRRSGIPLEDISILNACSGLGGDLISFAKVFSNVTAVEMCPERITMAKKNAEIYSVVDKINWITEDINMFCQRSCHYTWSFCSPPWGGHLYKENTNFKFLSNSSFDIHNCILNLARICDNIGIFLPPNQCIDDLLEVAAQFKRPVHILIDYISIGLKSVTKYVVVYFVRKNFLYHSSLNIPKSLALILTDFLEEKTFHIPSFIFLIKGLGVNNILKLYDETRYVLSQGGMATTTDPNIKRSKGGIFYFLLKKRYKQVYQDLEKFRIKKPTKKKNKRNTGCSSVTSAKLVNVAE